MTFAPGPPTAMTQVRNSLLCARSSRSRRIAAALNPEQMMSSTGVAVGRADSEDIDVPRHNLQHGALVVEKLWLSSVERDACWFEDRYESACIFRPQGKNELVHSWATSFA